MILSITAVEGQSITLKGRSVSIEDELLDENGNFNFDKDFLVSENINAEEGGEVLYKKSSSLYEDYANRLSEYNQALKDKRDYENNNLIELFDFAAKAVNGIPGDVASNVVRNLVTKVLLKDPLYSDPDSKLYIDVDTRKGMQKAAQKAATRLASQGVKSLKTKIFGS